MDRLSTLDAEFLYMEDEVAHMHLAGVCVFEDPPPTLGHVQDLIASQLAAIPRYRQRVRAVPFELGRPVWVDDLHFHLPYHLHRVALPAPGGDGELAELMGDLMSQPLDRRRPLWEAWLVEGVAGGRWALIFKVHHCMVDGIAGVELLTALLSLDPTVEVGEPAVWRPQRAPSGAALVADAWMGATQDIADWLARVPGAVLHPVDTAKSTLGMGRGLLALTRRLGVTPPLSIEGSIGPHRVWASSSASLGDVKAIGAAFGGTVNDVVLAAVSAGYRELLTCRGEDPDHAVVRSMVPVSVRSDRARGSVDNEVSTLLVDLPVHLADPLERLRLVTEQMNTLKASHMAEAAEVVTHIGNLAPPMAVAAVTRWALRAERVVPQRVVNTVTTNVPGPQFPLYCLGRQMVEYRPFVPISYGLRIGTAILSYNGGIFFGVTGDYDTAGDVDVVARGTTAAIDELRELIGAVGR